MTRCEYGDAHIDGLCVYCERNALREALDAERARAEKAERERDEALDECARLRGVQHP